MGSKPEEGSISLVALVGAMSMVLVAFCLMGFVLYACLGFPGLD